MTSWCQKVLDAAARFGTGSLLVEFPAYRPDLVEAMAAALGCAHVDFRRERMAPMKFDAHRLELEEIEVCALERSAGAGVVLHNAEALLAAKPAAERRDWLLRFLDVPRSNLVVLPLALFGKELADHPRLIRLTPEDLPAESLLTQLTSMRFQ